MADKQYILGMDIGTTSVKVCVYDPDSKEIIAKQNKDTAANIPSDQGIEGNKQDVPKIVSAVHSCVSRLPRDLLRHVKKIGVCGQMHGVVLWKNSGNKLVPLSPKSSSDDGIHEELRELLKNSRETYSDFSIFGNKPSICIQKVAFGEMELVQKTTDGHPKTGGGKIWQSTELKAWDKVEKDGNVIRFEAVRENMSALYTWQDTRCKPEFLDTLPKPDSHLKCYSGYGCATLLWMLKHKPGKLGNFNCSGTVEDFVVSMLCDLDVPIMSDQNAASWGYFNTEKNEWNVDILQSVGFPVNLLPKIAKSGEFAGKLNSSWNGIPEGTPVSAALGDLQCSMLATLETSQDAVLNISTSAQLAIIANSKTDLGCSTVEHLPYFGSTYLVVAASLNGGNLLATFVQMLQQWMLEFGFPIPQSKVWEKLIAISTAAPPSSESEMKIIPHLLGERHAPTAKVSVADIDLSNIQLASVFRSLCDSLIQNLHSMMPKEILRNANIKRIVGNGSGLSRNVVLQRAVEHHYCLPLEFTSGGDAAKGAAVAVAGK